MCGRLTGCNVYVISFLNYLFWWLSSWRLLVFHIYLGARLDSENKAVQSLITMDLDGINLVYFKMYREV